MSEDDRLAAVEGTGLVGRQGGERLERVVRQAAERLHAPIALLSLVGAERQWNPAVHGPGPQELAREDSFCAAAIEQPDGLVVPDAAADPAWADNPFVAAEGGVRFYAGRPVSGVTGERLGTLCVLDTQPREFGEDERRALRELAAWAELELASAHVADALAAGRRGSERAEELGRLQDLIITATAHDLRTPLTVITAHAELLAMDPTLQGPQRESVEAIVAATTELQRHVASVLRALRDEAGGAEEALRVRLGMDRASGGQGTGQ